MTSEGFQHEAYLNPPGVWLEGSGWVFGRHSTLDRAAVHPDLVLFEAELWQAAALAHMQLGVHQVHTVGDQRDNEAKTLNDNRNTMWTAQFPLSSENLLHVYQQHLFYKEFWCLDMIIRSDTRGAVKGKKTVPQMFLCWFVEKVYS